MQIISHRGYWKHPDEKNSQLGFDRSFSLSFGTETDFRDYHGELVIAHDMATPQSIKANNFFETYLKYGCTSTLALNIKADGLQLKMRELIDKYKITNYFVFDMSIPDTIGYIKQGLNFYSRQSEYEAQPAFYNECAGIWLDAFLGTWYNNDLILNHLNNNKQVAIVSPELHGREHLLLWQQLKAGNLHQQNDLILCTDIPEDAVTFFEA
ncbi:MAG: hypothetical protein V4592_22725 [Bacteroidota bacterium]